MPSLVTDLRMNCDIQRETYELFSQNITGATVSITAASRTDPFYVAVTLTGWTGADGSVTVTGLLAGVTVSVSLPFDGNARRIGVNQKFDTLISVTTVGFSANAGFLGSLLNFTLGGIGTLDTGQVRVDAVSRSGQPDEVLTTIATGAKCKITRARLGGLQQSPGEAPIDQARIFFFPEQELFKQDRLLIDGERWQVKGVAESFRLSTGMPYYKVVIAHSEDQT